MADTRHARPITRRVLLASAIAVHAGASVAADAATQAPPRVVRAADGRLVSISSWAPAGARRGTILFSHGFGCSPSGYEALLRPWAKAGFLVLAPLHVDAPDHPDHARLQMATVLPTRLLDMRAAAGLARDAGVIAAGHSYGGLIALTLGGATPIAPAGLLPVIPVARVRAAIAFSPPGPMPGLIDDAGYANIEVPFLLETGDHDFPIMNGKPGDWHDHLTAFRVARSRARFALTLPGVDHFFGNIIGHPDRKGPAESTQFAEALSASLEFLRSFGIGDPAAERAFAQRGDLLKA